MTNELTKEEMDEFKKLKKWVSKCPIEATMKIQELEKAINGAKVICNIATEEKKKFEQQNKRYREAIEKAEQWLKKMNDRIESHERPDWWSDQTERLREFYGRADGMETILEVIHKALEGEEWHSPKKN